MELIYLDNHLFILNKPCGILTQSPGLEDEAKAWLKAKYKKPGAVFLHAIHRLDRVASGLVLFARTSKALSRLQAAMRAQMIEKTYFAEVEGVLQNKEAILEHYLEHGAFKAILSPQGKKAILHYKVIDEAKGNSRLEIVLKTGRYHQIRAQLAAIGHPILGDTKYGSHQLLKSGGIALKHTRLAFVHPVTQEKMRFNLEGDA